MMGFDFLLVQPQAFIESRSRVRDVTLGKQCLRMQLK